jgi:hypothetical protein
VLREQVLDALALWDRQGYTQQQMGSVKMPERFGFTLSVGQVSKNLAIVKRRYANAAMASRQEKVNEQLAALRDVRREAWEAYHLSMVDAVKVTEEWETETTEVEGGDLASSERVVKRIVAREGRLPANQYLATIMGTHKAERELLGLDEEVNQRMMAISEAEAILKAVLEAQREVLAGHPELLAAVQQRCVALVPFMHQGQPVRVIEQATSEEQDDGDQA